MGMTATLTANANPVLGNAGTMLTLTVSNSGGSQVNVNSVQPVVQSVNGVTQASLPFNIGAVTAPGSQPSVPQVGGSQFNVPVPAGGSTVFTFAIQCFMPAVNGPASQAVPEFLVSANIQTSDGSVFTPATPIYLALNGPTWGLPGSPPNLVPLSGQLIFNSPAASALVL